jgi:hypothetical protein
LFSSELTTLLFAIDISGVANLELHV